jgi:hypothetical protein
MAERVAAELNGGPLITYYWMYSIRRCMPEVVRLSTAFGPAHYAGSLLCQRAGGGGHQCEPSKHCMHVISIVYTVIDRYGAAGRVEQGPVLPALSRRSKFAGYIYQQLPLIVTQRQDAQEKEGALPRRRRCMALHGALQSALVPCCTFYETGTSCIACLGAACFHLFMPLCRPAPTLCARCPPITPCVLVHVLAAGAVW